MKDLENKDEDEIREYVFDLADTYFESSPSSPVIHESSNPEIVPID